MGDCVYWVVLHNEVLPLLVLLLLIKAHLSIDYESQVKNNYCKTDINIDRAIITMELKAAARTWPIICLGKMLIGMTHI